jgi:hypothetical protein
MLFELSISTGIFLVRGGRRSNWNEGSKNAIAIKSSNNTLNAESVKRLTFESGR